LGGPTDPWLWAPLNPLAAIVRADIELACRPCHKPVCRLGHHLCMRDIAAERILHEVMAALADPSARTARPASVPHLAR
jgi:heptosyltransferase-2